MGGDFNAVKCKEEMRVRGVGFKLGYMEDFSSFIDMMELVDMSVLGCLHTWINTSCSASSRIDRFFLSKGIIQAWNIVAQVTGSRDISDHRPIWIKACNLSWGPKPFKVYNGWFEHRDFLEFVKYVWESCPVQGENTFILK